MMDCEEFELRGLDLDRADADPQEAAAAAKHAEICGRCSAMLESWREVKCDLRLLRESTWLDSAPARVEMRLKQELRTRREARGPHRTAVIASWALAAAAVVVASLGWMQIHHKAEKSVVAERKTVNDRRHVDDESERERKRCAACRRFRYWGVHAIAGQPEQRDGRRIYSSSPHAAGSAGALWPSGGSGTSVGIGRRGFSGWGGRAAAGGPPSSRYTNRSSDAVRITGFERREEEALA